MRCIIFVAFCVCALPVFATTLTGSINIAGSPNTNIDVGYVGFNSAKQQIEGFVGMKHAAGMPNSRQTVFEHRKNTVAWSPRSGFSYEFTNVPPGQYLLYVRAGNRLEEWKNIQVTAGAAGVKNNFTLNPAHTGMLHIKAGRGKAKYMLLLTPCAANGEPLLRKADLMRFGIIELIDGDNITLKTLKPGTYLVDLRGAMNMGRLPGAKGKGIKLTKVTIAEGKMTTCTVR